jgi:ADP-heptose:LPS heptosyltransferase
MDNLIKLSCPSEGLGDTLILTCICKHLLANNKKPIVSLPAKIKRFSILFDGIADVIIEDVNQYLPDLGGGHYATRKLRNFFQHAELLDNRPLVLHSNQESEIWTANYLINKINPVIFVPHCAKQWHEVRSLKVDSYEQLFDKLISDGLTPIICQSSSNPVSIKYENILTDLELSKYICLLRKVGLYVGCNTGDMHLAISVGAHCQVIQPQNHPLFNADEWNYNHPSITYYQL